MRYGLSPHVKALPRSSDEGRQEDMTKFRRTTLVDQTVEYIRDGIRKGRWKHRLPGIRALAAELDVSSRTLLGALKALADAGDISSKGPRSPYVIASTAPRSKQLRSLRVALLVPGAFEKQAPSLQALLLHIVYRARLDGHDAFILSSPTGKSPHKTGYLGRMVREAKADVWLLHHASLETIRWFGDNGVSCLTLGGRSQDTGLPSANFDVRDAVRALVRRLAELRHRRIVLVISDLSRNPTPSPIVIAYREALTECGITPGEYNHPDWEESPEGLRKLFESLFALTPPTAIICWHPDVLASALVFLAERRLSVPGHVSLFGFSESDFIPWQFPGMRIAHFKFDEEAWIQHIRKWINIVSAGKEPPRTFVNTTGLDEGTTIGEARR